MIDTDIRIGSALSCAGFKMPKAPLCPEKAMAPFVLQAKGLDKVYQNGKIKLEVLKEVNLAVKPGELLCIIGPSGAGKSTLLHILGGLDEPTKGQVLFEGEDLYAFREAQRAKVRNKRFGFVFQFYHLLPELNALENVLLPALIESKTFAQAQERAQELLRLVGLKERMAHKPTQLSGGEQQRAAIARALINNPDIIFCDEPTGNLDSQGGEQIVQLLDNLNQGQAKTLVIVSHEERITKIAKRIVHIQDGRLV